MSYAGIRWKVTGKYAHQTVTIYVQADSEQEARSLARKGWRKGTRIVRSEPA